jgi:hypothetical protein
LALGLAAVDFGFEVVFAFALDAPLPFELEEALPLAPDDLLPPDDLAPPDDLPLDEVLPLAPEVLRAEVVRDDDEVLPDVFLEAAVAFPPFAPALAFCVFEPADPAFDCEEVLDVREDPDVLEAPEVFERPDVPEVFDPPEALEVFEAPLVREVDLPPVVRDFEAVVFFAVLFDPDEPPLVFPPARDFAALPPVDLDFAAVDLDDLPADDPDLEPDDDFDFEAGDFFADDEVFFAFDEVFFGVAIETLRTYGLSNYC